MQGSLEFPIKPHKLGRYYCGKAKEYRIIVLQKSLIKVEAFFFLRADLESNFALIQTRGFSNFYHSPLPTGKA